MIFNLIACVDKNYGIAKNNDIPWKLNKDLIYFKKTTISENDKSNIVIMGNNTYNSIPNKFKPLKNRINIILSRSNNKTDLSELSDYSTGKLINKPIYFNDIIDLLLYLDTIKKDVNNVYIIGGSEIYNLFLDYKLISNIYITHINNANFNCDKFLDMEKYKKQFILTSSIDDNDIDKNTNTRYFLSFNTYSYKNKEENKFIKTVNKILNKGIYNLDRSQVGTLSIFGKSFTYDIRNYRIPLFTHRKMFLRGIIEELIFFVSGKTDTKLLESKNVNIWKGHTSREFLDSRGLTNYKEGDMGAGYGFQLKHFGADYKSADYDYTNQGVNQLKYVINEIKNNPTSRRIIFSYWNPHDFDKIALVPCHILYQFNINIETNELSCSFYQRSSDWVLAADFNICSATVLVFMICHLTGYKPGKIIHNVGNIHIYMNQIDEVKKMINNELYNFPLLIINDSEKKIKKIEDFQYENFKLLFYRSNKKYSIPMSV